MPLPFKATEASERARDRRDLLICAALDAGKRQGTIAARHGVTRGVVVKLGARAQTRGRRRRPRFL